MPGMDDGELQCYILDTIARIDRASDRDADSTDDRDEQDEVAHSIREQSRRLKRKGLRWKIRQTKSI